MLICQLTDLHVRPVGKPANRVVETNMFTERAFRAVARLNPRPGRGGDHRRPDRLRSRRGIRQPERGCCASSLPMPVFVIPGNHDRRGNLREGLKHLPGVAADPRYVQYAVDEYPVRLVMLDTLVPGAGHGELRPEQLEFLDRTLAAAPDKPTIVGMHHPPFACGMAHMDRINLRILPAFAAIIARHPPGRSGSSAATTTGRSSPGWRMPSPRSHLRWRIRSRCR